MSDQSAARPKPDLLTWALWCAALIGVAAVVYIIVEASFKPAQSPPAAAAPAGSKFSAKLTRPAAPTPAPDYVFYDASGAPKRIADFRGKVVVMNIWATWCAPCRQEMPTLAKLAAAYRGKPVAIVPVSIDSPADAAKARVFIAQNQPLGFYADTEMKLPWALKPAALGAPTTVIYGPDGMERGRVSGEADWSAAAPRAFIDRLLAQR